MNRCMKALLLVSMCCTAAAGAAGAGSDGSWQVLKPSNTGVPGEEARCIAFAPDGEVWVGARWPFWYEGGVGAYDPADETWTTWSNWDSPIPSEFVHDIEFGPDGAVWMATREGLVRKQDDTWTAYTADNSPLLQDSVVSIEFESGGAMWIRNSSVEQALLAALFRIDGDPDTSSWEMHAVPDIPFPQPWSGLSGLCVDSRDRVWVANSVVNGVAVYEGGSWSLLPGSTADTYKFITEDLDGNIWLLAGNLGYSFYKYDGVSLTEFSAANTPLAQTTITTAAVDEDGAFYVGNWMGQIIRTTNGGDSWTMWLSGLNIVKNIAPDPYSSDIWIVTPGAFGQFENDGTWVRDFNSYNSGVPWYWTDQFILDPNGHMWLATNEAGLSHYDGERWRNWGAHNAGSEPYPFQGNDEVSSFFMDSTGTGWMGGNGIAQWDPKTGAFTGFWNWENNPGMGVGQWVAFAEDAAGTLFSSEEYGNIYRFDPDAGQWDFELHVSANSGLPGMVSDDAGNVWVAGRWDIHKWDGVAWTTVQLPDDNYFFDLGGMTDIALGPDGTMWLGTNDGLVRWDGRVFTRYGTDNSPLPYTQAWRVDVRDDGLLAIGNLQFAGSDGGVVTVDGDIDDPANWTIHPYSETPLPHWQIGDVAFDAQGDLWASCMSEGVAVLDLPDSTVIGDVDGDNLVGVSDLLVLISAWGACDDANDCPADLDGDRVVSVSDLLLLLGNWG